MFILEVIRLPWLALLLSLVYPDWGWAITQVLPTMWSVLYSDITSKRRVRPTHLYGVSNGDGMVRRTPRNDLRSCDALMHRKVRGTHPTLARSYIM